MNRRWMPTLLISAALCACQGEQQTEEPQTVIVEQGRPAASGQSSAATGEAGMRLEEIWTESGYPAPGSTTIHSDFKEKTRIVARALIDRDFGAVRRGMTPKLRETWSREAIAETWNEQTGDLGDLLEVEPSELISVVGPPYVRQPLLFENGRRVVVVMFDEIGRLAVLEIQ